ncbi:hypothetical protein ACHAPY_005696 [Fusarium culmorum]
MPLLPLNWRHLADSARWCEEAVLGPIMIGDQALSWISLPVCEATVTVLAAHLITVPERDLEETFPDAEERVERGEMELDEQRLRDALQHYDKFLHGIKDPQVFVHYNMCKELISKAGQTVRIFFDNTTSDFWDANKNGLAEEGELELYMNS